MKYVIDMLKHEVKKETSYACQHRKSLAETQRISDKRVFEMSIRLAEERIPQLKKSLKLLTEL